MYKRGKNFKCRGQVQILKLSALFRVFGFGRPIIIWAKESNQIKYTACYIQVEKETPQTTSPAARMPNRTGALPSLHEKSFTGMPETMCICSYTVILYPFQNPRLFKSYPCPQDARYFTISLKFHLHLNGMTNADRALLSPHTTCK